MTSKAEQILYLSEWSAKNSAILQLNGTCGFGRPCVGILEGTNYIDTEKVKDTYYSEWWQPKNAYHKHDCLAVLVHGEETRDARIEELYNWVKWLDEHDYRVQIWTQEPKDVIDLMVHGITRAELYKHIVYEVPEST